MSQDLEDYLDGHDIKKVARGARNLEREAFKHGQISKEQLEETLKKSDKELFNERNYYRKMVQK